uniref:Uncharacterized protein n=1 Tax=Graphocephala atropunctata TaxID=36148 RepID=A0A1B6LA95_9HEMI
MAVRGYWDHYGKLSNKSLQTPPRSNSVQQSRSQTKDRKLISEESKGCKNFRTYTKCDQVFGVLPKNRVSSKEFSRYTRLPAIGNIPEDRPKLLRQLTYTVLQPVYVRGPPETVKFSPIRESKKSGQKNLEKEETAS